MANSDTKMLNKAKVLGRLQRVAPAVQDGAAVQLRIEVEDFVGAVKRAAPVDPASDDPGKLEQSVHAYPNPDRPLSYRVIVDAKDAEGHFIATNVETGHRAVDGTHVHASPFFYPTYRARKAAMRRRLSAASRKAAKALFPDTN